MAVRADIEAGRRASAWVDARTRAAGHPVRPTTQVSDLIPGEGGICERERDFCRRYICRTAKTYLQMRGYSASHIASELPPLVHYLHSLPQGSDAWMAYEFPYVPGLDPDVDEYLTEPEYVQPRVAGVDSAAP